ELARDQVAVERDHHGAERRPVHALHDPEPGARLPQGQQHENETYPAQPRVEQRGKGASRRGFFRVWRNRHGRHGINPLTIVTMALGEFARARGRMLTWRVKANERRRWECPKPKTPGGALPLRTEKSRVS